MRTDVLCDVNWEGRETESGNIIYGWLLGTVCVVETSADGNPKFEVYVSHAGQGVDGEALVLHWSVFDARETAMTRHDALVRELRELGEHGLFARPFLSAREAGEVAP